MATQASKNAEAATKQLATQELQAKKFRMQEWKRNVMAVVAYEFQGMKAAQVEAMNAQKQSFRRSWTG